MSSNWTQDTRLGEHIPPTILRQFGACGADDAAPMMPERLAIDVALHLDSCEECAHTLAAMDPNAALFDAIAHVAPISAPAGLAETVLADFHRPQQAPIRELLIGSSFLGAALVLVLVDSTAIIAESVVTWSAMSTAGSAVIQATQLWSTTLTIGIAVAVIGGIATAGWVRHPLSLVDNGGA